MPLQKIEYNFVLVNVNMPLQKVEYDFVLVVV